MNPFASRREKKAEIQEHKIKELEEKYGDQIGQMRQQQQMQAMDGGSDMSFKLPEQSNDYEAENFDKYLPKSAMSDQAPPEWSGSRGGQVQYEPPSRAWQCAYKLQNGFVIGASLGSAIGFLYGTWAAISYRHVLYLPIAVLQSGGAFGLFLACGTVIRCEETGEEMVCSSGLQAAAACNGVRAAAAAARPALLGMRESSAARLPAAQPSRLAREIAAAPLSSRRSSSAVLAAVLSE